MVSTQPPARPTNVTAPAAEYWLGGRRSRNSIPTDLHPTFLLLLLLRLLALAMRMYPVMWIKKRMWYYAELLWPSSVVRLDGALLVLLPGQQQHQPQPPNDLQPVPG
jgi:hypothetical protein